jgi:ABC-2 type transport system ATP-binding protein
MIDVSHLSKRYVSRLAVDDVSFHIDQGKVVGFLGPNGAGKSTTLRILTGYLAPTSGDAHVAGFNVLTDPIQARRQLGYMPENVPLYSDLRVKEYLRYRAALKGLRGQQIRHRVGEVMDRCGLTEVRRKMIGTLSKGFRQRVALADAIVHDPPLVILDEPTNGLDPNQIRQVRQLISQLGESHTVLISTHILREVEATCNHVIIIDRGKIKAADSPRQLIANLRTSSRLRVELADAPDAADQLAALKGMRMVEPRSTSGEWQAFNLRTASGIDLREQIAQLARDRCWRLRELASTKASLEDVFVELTHEEPS